MKFGIYQNSYVRGLEAEVDRLKQRETQLLNTAFSLHGISAPFAPPRTEGNMKPLGKKSWPQKLAELEAAERIRGNREPDAGTADTA